MCAKLTSTTNRTAEDECQLVWCMNVWQCSDGARHTLDTSLPISNVHTTMEFAFIQCNHSSFWGHLTVMTFLIVRTMQLETIHWTLTAAWCLWARDSVEGHIIGKQSSCQQGNPLSYHFDDVTDLMVTAWLDAILLVTKAVVTKRICCHINTMMWLTWC